MKATQRKETPNGNLNPFAALDDLFPVLLAKENIVEADIKKRANRESRTEWAKAEAKRLRERRLQSKRESQAEWNRNFKQRQRLLLPGERQFA